MSDFNEGPFHWAIVAIFDPLSEQGLLIGQALHVLVQGADPRDSDCSEHAAIARSQRRFHVVQDAMDWTKHNRDLNPANAIIVYGWNENDEGGWLIPTWKPDGQPDSSRLDAVSHVLKR